MDDMRLVGVAHDYAELHEILRKVVEKREISREQIDDIAGFPSGYASKLLSPIPMKFLGPISLNLILGTLGLAIAVVENPQAIEKMSRRYLRKHADRVRALTRHQTIEEMLSYRLYKVLRDRTKKARMASPVGPETARRAAMARWAHKRQGKSAEKRTEDAI